MHGSDTRLATYGTLAPGEVNAHELAALQGHWRQGTVTGHLHDAGWGAAHGCPGLVPGEDGSPIPVHLFESQDLPEHWARLDAFEGSGYRRIVMDVETQSGTVPANIYVLAI